MKRKYTYNKPSSKKQKSGPRDEFKAPAMMLLKDLKPTKGVKVKEVVENLGIASSVIRRIGTIAQGVGSRERVGDSVVLQSIQLKLLLREPPGLLAADNVPSMNRILVIIDKNMNGATPIAADILDQSATPIQRLLSPITFVNKDRFVILHDSWHEMDFMTPYLNNVGAPVCNGQTKFVNVYKRLGTQQTYSGALATDGLAGNIYVYWQNCTAANNPSGTMVLEGTIKTRYTDPQ